MLQPKPANLPEPSATGSLAKKPLAHLLIYAHDRKLSGTFELCDETGTSVHVVVSEGRVARVGTSDSVTFLGHVLYENGFIDDAQLSASLAEVAATKRLHGQVLLEKNLITHAQLAEGLRQQRARKLQHAFTLPKETTFAFYSEVDLVGERPNDVEPMDPLPCVWRGVREHPSWDHVRATITRVGGRPVHLRQGVAELARLGLDQDEIAAAECLRIKACTVPELAIVGGLTIQATDLLAYFLIITKLVELGDRHESAASSVTPPASNRVPMIVNAPGAGFASGEYVRKISFTMSAVTPDAQKLRIPSPVPNRIPSPMPGRIPSPMPGRLSMPTPGASSPPAPARVSSMTPGRIPSPLPPGRSVTPYPGDVALPTASSPPAGASSSSIPPSSDSARRKSIIERAKWIEKEDYFKVLMVPREAMTEEIRAAFLRAAKVWHPDSLPQALVDVRVECDRVFRHITQAYETLVDPGKRRQYERAIGNKIRESAEADHFLDEAQMHLTIGDRGQAEVLARKALVASQGMPDATALLVYLEATDPRRGTPEHLRASLKMIDMAINKDPQTCRRGHFYRAELKKRLEDHEGAIRDLRIAVTNDPDDPDAERELKLYEKRVREGVIQIRSLSPSGGVKKPEGFFDRLRKKVGARSDEGNGHSGQGSALTAAAAAVETEPHRYTELAGAAVRVPLSSEKNVDRASRAIVEAAESEKRVLEHVQALVQAITTAREAQQTSAAALSAHAEAVSQKRAELDALLARFAKLGEVAKTLNAAMQKVAGYKLNPYSGGSGEVRGVRRGGGGGGRRRDRRHGDGDDRLRRPTRKSSRGRRRPAGSRTSGGRPTPCGSKSWR